MVQMELQAVQYCFQPSNLSCSKEVRPTAVYVVMYISAAAVVMLTVCGNLLVIISISHFKQLHTATNLLLLSLAVADFLVGLIVMPFGLIVLIETCWYFGETFCIVYNIFCFVLPSVSISNVACIAIDRYVAVCDPLLYSNKITSTRTWSVILLNWTLSFLYNLALLYFNGNFTGLDEFNICFGDCQLFINEIWGIVDLLVVFFFPCSVMITLYVKIFIVAKRHAQVISCITEQISSDKNKNKISSASERKAAKTLGILVVVFLFCLVPYYICTLVNENVSQSSSSVLINFLVWLVYLNSTANPIIYALFYPWFQTSLKSIIMLRIFKPGSSLLTLFPQKM
ncbi:trace amine-associated receptor 13c-like [Amia ocellicauda]|uniref:trace amine-associated receptor 13c-like n=1 Tax=Amia ocellicauda TaxID=2972642 RepID=UPI003464AF45